MSQPSKPIDPDTLNFLTQSIKRHIDSQLLPQLQQQLTNSHQVTSQLLNYMESFWQKLTKLARDIMPCIEARHSLFVDIISNNLVLKADWLINPHDNLESTYLKMLVKNSEVLIGCSQIYFRLQLLKGVCILKDCNGTEQKPEAIVKDLHKIMSFCRILASHTGDTAVQNWLQPVMTDLIKDTNCLIFLRNLRNLAEKAQLQDVIEQIKKKQDSQEVRDMLKKGEDIKPQNIEKKQNNKRMSVNTIVNEIILEERSQTGVKVKPKQQPTHRHFTNLRRKSFIKPILQKIQSQPQRMMTTSNRQSFVRLSTMTNFSESIPHPPSEPKTLVLATQTPLRKKQSKPT